MDLNTTKLLNSGARMPIFGLGVFKSRDGEETYNAVRWALDAGYRHIDTAAVYGNEASVGRAIHDSGIPRDQLWITTKLWNTEIRAHNEEAAFAESLRKLGTSVTELRIAAVYILQRGIQVRLRGVELGLCFIELKLRCFLLANQICLLPVQLF